MWHPEETTNNFIKILNASKYFEGKLVKIRR